MRIQLLRADVTSLKVDAMVNPTQSEEESASGANLLAKFVIPARVPPPMAANADHELRRVTIRALEKAEELAVGSVGVPPMWTGPQQDLTERCARSMLQAAIEFSARARSLQRVVFVIFGKNTYEVYDRVLRELTP